MAPTKTSLEQLAAKASKLNAKTDELNGIFESLEAKLAASNIGVTAWVADLLESEEGEPDERGCGDEGWTIGYAKVGGNWRLAARRERWPYTMEAPRDPDSMTSAEIHNRMKELESLARERLASGAQTEKNYGNDAIVIGSPVPLVQAPRSVRATAAGMLDVLIEELSDKVDEYLANIEKAKAMASVTK